MFVLTISKKKFYLFSAVFVLCCSVLFFYLHISAPSTYAEEEGISVPILMYHSILKDPGKLGDYVLSPEVLEEDMRYLKDHGYTTVVVQDLIDYVYHDKSLPPKPVMLTFDDGHYNNLTYVYPLLEKYQMKAVISIVGSYSQQFTDAPDPNPAYAYLSWEDIKTLSKSGLIEFQNHTYDMHKQEGRKGCRKKPEEPLETYAVCLKEDLMKNQMLIEAASGKAPTALTYPYGAFCKESQQIIKQLGFRASLSCYEHENRITKDPECLYQLNRYNRPSWVSTEELMKKAGIIP